MNDLENTIVDILLETDYYEVFDKNSITPESCREVIENYSHPFRWSEKEKIEKFLRPVEGLPSDLLSAACLLAWNQVNWDLIAESIRNQV